ncbi:hypothetical protein J3459_010685 [Metarhizium acridum]|nr:hypothetical protein J3459_010685 [Metarhizium acridum]
MVPKLSNNIGTLVSAAPGQNIQTVEFLLGKNVNFNAASTKSPYYTALQAAAHAESLTTIVQILLDNRANVNLDGGSYGSPLCAAIEVENIDMAKLLINAKADVNYTGGERGTPLELALTALIHATRCEDEYKVQKLLKKGGHLLSRDVRGRDALYWAALNGNADIFDVVSLEWRTWDKLNHTLFMQSMPPQRLAR